MVELVWNRLYLKVILVDMVRLSNDKPRVYAKIHDTSPKNTKIENAFIEQAFGAKAVCKTTGSDVFMFRDFAEKALTSGNG